MAIGTQGEQEAQAGLALDFRIKPKFEEIEPSLYNKYLSLEAKDEITDAFRKNKRRMFDELAMDRNTPYEQKKQIVLYTLKTFRDFKNDQEGAGMILVYGLYELSYGDIMNLSAKNPLPQPTRQQSEEIKKLTTERLHEVIDLMKLETPFIQQYVMKSPSQ